MMELEPQVPESRLSPQGGDRLDLCLEGRCGFPGASRPELLLKLKVYYD